MKIKELLGYASGWKATKGGLTELKNAASVPTYFAKVVVDTISGVFREAKADRRLAELDAEGLWDCAVHQYGITTEIVKTRFFIIYWLNAILWAAFLLVAGNLLANLAHGTQFVISNLFFLNIMFIVIFNSAYKMHCAITQSMPHPLRFLKEALSRPGLLFSRQLPSDYAVGVRK